MCFVPAADGIAVVLHQKRVIFKEKEILKDKRFHDDDDDDDDDDTDDSDNNDDDNWSAKVKKREKAKQFRSLKARYSDKRGYESAERKGKRKVKEGRN